MSVSGKPSLGSQARREEGVAWLFLAPSLVLFAVFTGLPVISAFFISFTHWDLFNPPRLALFDNYIALWNDPIFRQVLGNTGYYVALAVPLQMLLGLLCALGLNRGVPGQGVFRVIYFLPVVTSTVAAGLVWAWLFNSNFGLINMGLSLLGASELPKWLVSSRWAMPAVIAVSVWQGLGYAMVLFLAGLQNIRRDVYEAAAIDGATGLTRLWYITLPLLSPMTFFVLIISIIGSFQVFELVYVMTKAGPSNATNTLVFFIYQNGFMFYQMGIASAAAMVLFLIVLALTLVQYRLQNRWVHYE
ncbi:MAG: sugar ABC transporter permease [Devosia sp.]|jgi:multiple sugar transport system permease protein|uniref:carbohydrate ABC transporter permease n=1 Tax=Devosia sp. 66-22 TaxID=1895753 RepID=UPI000927CEF4|nr:sugar ABC transporter permease [Devosia sp. 66-22]MBN9347545.1 sugar ABC transporter permease [Devosia sp.]OJX55410.1 MAG: sugar ABC transporter permease [Devosia sp. 66-22]